LGGTPKSGLTIFGEGGHSNAIINLLIDKPVTPEDIEEALCLFVGGGFGSFKNKSVRIGHYSYQQEYDPADLASILRGILL
jgi:aspartate aminotransferase-like enzyme